MGGDRSHDPQTVAIAIERQFSSPKRKLADLFSERCFNEDFGVLEI
jgi:hypothetical protein